MGRASLSQRRAVKGLAVISEQDETSDPSLQRVVDQFIRRVQQFDAKRSASVESNPSENGQPGVLLDVAVNGVRCVLTRCETASNRESTVLSPREQEIARMVMKGYPNKTIAAVLDISVWTVGTHLRRIFAKLGVGTRASMVAHLLESRHHELA